MSANDPRLKYGAIEDGWHKTFSTQNPYCPCDLNSFTKAVRWAESAIAKIETQERAEVSFKTHEDYDDVSYGAADLAAIWNDCCKEHRKSRLGAKESEHV